MSWVTLYHVVDAYVVQTSAVTRGCKLSMSWVHANYVVGNTLPCRGYVCRADRCSNSWVQIIYVVDAGEVRRGCNSPPGCKRKVAGLFFIFKSYVVGAGELCRGGILMSWEHVVGGTVCRGCNSPPGCIRKVAGLFFIFKPMSWVQV